MFLSFSNFGFFSYSFQWNSTSWDEFARKWNKPVHTFLLRHVYRPTRNSYRISRSGAMFLTYLLSALAHELVMVIVTKKIRSVTLPGSIYILSEWIHFQGCISSHCRSARFSLVRSNLDLKFYLAHPNSLDHAWTYTCYQEEHNSWQHSFLGRNLRWITPALCGVRSVLILTAKKHIDIPSFIL
jgi:hypothetical protein